MFNDMVKELKCSIKWGAYARVDTITEETARAMKCSGCYYLYIGVESGSDRILEFMRKGINREQIIRAISCLKQNDIKVLCSFIIGYPGESDESIDDTIDLIKRTKPDGVYLFPFELRENTEIETIYSAINVQENSNTKNMRMIYGRLLPREFIPWQNTNALYNWIDILNKTTEIKNYISRAFLETFSEADLISMMALTRPA